MSCTPTKLPNHKITKRADGSLRVSSSFKVAEGKARTEQSHRGECDIRNIVRRYAKAGEPLPPVNPAAYSGEDYIAPPQFDEAMRVVASAQSVFAALPSKIRDRFKNDPREFMEFLHNPANADEAVGLGLAVKRPVAAPSNAPEAPSKTASSPKKTPAAKADGGQPKGDSDQ